MLHITNSASLLLCRSRTACERRWRNVTPGRVILHIPGPPLGVESTSRQKGAPCRGYTVDAHQHLEDSSQNPLTSTARL